MLAFLVRERDEFFKVQRGHCLSTHWTSPRKHMHSLTQICAKMSGSGAGKVVLDVVAQNIE